MDDLDRTRSVLGGVNTEAGPGQAYLVVVRGQNVGQIVPFVGPAMVIGRGVGADLRVSDDGVSRFHCKLRAHEHGILVEDLGSRNGTYRNGERVIAGTQPLVEGDRLQIGTTFVLRFTYLEQQPNPDLAVADPIEDPLTKTSSRRYLVEQLEAEITSTARHRLAVVLVHVDRFQERAAHGQQLADDLEIATAKHLREHVREGDVLARVDRGDFAIMLRGASPGDTFMLAERICKSSAANIPVAPGQPPVTLSLGIASVAELPIATAQDALAAANSALHRARSNGGNRSVLCTPDLLGEPRTRTNT